MPRFKKHIASRIKEYLILVCFVNDQTCRTCDHIEELFICNVKYGKENGLLPSWIIKANMDLETAFNAPMDNPYQTARKYISNLCFKPMFSKYKA